MERTINSEQELAQRFAIFEEQIKLLQEQIAAVEQASINLTEINLGLDELIGKTNSEILAPIGRGIFVKAKLLSEDLIVDVGEKNFVKKSIPETKTTLKNQINKLNGIKGELDKEMEKISDELTNVFMEHQNRNK